MSGINLTSRKSPPPKLFGTYVKENENYTGRFSQAYRPEGHPFNQSFKILRSDYWFRYRILDQDDIATYETLQFLCEAEIPFTLSELAKESKCGKATLRKRLDNLENAELLEIVVSDGQGQPNYYILHTPFFRRHQIEGQRNLTRRNKILNEYDELPLMFIDDEHTRLLRQVRKNSIKKIRRIARRKKFAKNIRQSQRDVYESVKEKVADKKLIFHKIIKKLGNQDAITFANLVWKITKGLSDKNTTEYWNIFTDSLRRHCKQLNIRFDAFFA